jgi:hypothetical protein
MKCLNYRELEYHQVDSRICEQFVKTDPLRPYSFQVYQKYISKIRADSLDELLVSLNRIAISEGLEDLQSFRQDSTGRSNLTSSKNMETRLKKWRSGIEAVISNYKRTFEMFRCTWKGKSHFRQKVLWSAIAYNIRVMTVSVIVSFQ